MWELFLERKEPERVSGQKSPKLTNDAINEIHHVLKRIERRFTFDNPRMVERYVEREAGLVIHFRVNGLAEDFVAHFQRDNRSHGEAHSDSGELTWKPSCHLNTLEE